MGFFFALFSQPWSARYVLPSLPPFLVLLAGGIDALVVRVRPSVVFGTTLALTALVALPGLSFDRYLLSDPAQAPFPADDRRQLVAGWPAGYGVRELAARLAHEAEAGPLTVYVDTGGTRTVSADLGVILSRHSSVRLVEGDLSRPEFRALMIPELKARRVFAVLGPRTPVLDFIPLIQDARAEQVEVFRRPGGEWAATLFRLTSE